MRRARAPRESRRSAGDRIESLSGRSSLGEMAAGQGQGDVGGWPASWVAHRT
jgi:hypothetical protein